MTLFQMAALAVAPLALAVALSTNGLAGEAPRLSGPYTHDNLTIYFIHGQSVEGPVPLTLKEALEKQATVVTETGSVNELVIENTGNEAVFIQSGDIVKGGRQDRVLTTSLLLPPKSGKIPVGAFCVEAGRWRARGDESVAMFALSAEALPSREAKLAMKVRRAPKPIDADDNNRELRAGQSVDVDAGEQTSTRQGEIWNEVAKTQDKLSKNLDAPVASEQSASSLQLSLENEGLQKARAEYSAMLAKKGEEADDILGFVFVVNGKINSADVYPSNGLFRKMWGKLLTASVTEAIGDKDGVKVDPPTSEQVSQFLASAEKGAADTHKVADVMEVDTREADDALYVETRSLDKRWVHRNYLAK